MPKWTRRGALTAIFAIPLAGWSGFWRRMGVNPLIYRPLSPNPGQIYMNWLFEKHLESVRRVCQIKMVLGGDQEDVVLGEAYAEGQGEA